MDLKQSKLSIDEWRSIEISVSENEKTILKIIMEGFNNLEINYNDNKSLISFMKINPDDEIYRYLYNIYFESDIKKITNKIGIEYNISKSKKKISKKDQIRIDNTKMNIIDIKKNIFEYILLELVNMAVTPHKINKKISLKGYYTLIQLLKPTTTINNINPFVIDFIKIIIEWCSKIINIYDIFYESSTIIENNDYIMKYQDIKLFEHQKKLFKYLNENKNPTLIFYTSATGNGKTLTPLGLLSKYKVIFICASRHVSLALAKSAISMEKKIAIAFGCETIEDIRLHYFSAEVYTKNKKSGGIHKIDNSYGNNIELIICDTLSYIIAMNYMLLFNKEEDIITFWDEPTISMDVDEHPLHPIIHNNWCENKISKLILSCATMPKPFELSNTIDDFKLKFENSNIKNISSFDFKKTIKIIDNEGCIVLPHNIFSNNRDIINCIENIKENLTLLRYIDLKSIIDFIKNNNFEIDLNNISVENLTITTIKNIYLDVLLNNISNYDNWKNIEPLPFWKKENNNLRKINSDFITLSSSKEKEDKTLIKIKSTPPGILNIEYNGCIYLTTHDAYTLTDGPTLYLVEDTIKIGRFMFQQSQIDKNIINEIINCIEYNNKLESHINELQKKIDDILNNFINNEKRDKDENKEIREIKEYIESIRKQIKTIQLPSQYIPNTEKHQNKWCPDNKEKSFISNIDDSFIIRVMNLGDNISNEVKILLMMGIGIFCEELPISYLEIIKELSYSQKLYIIIASSDYIYGTNYQFCHGFLGRDLNNMTPQKIIQAMGRIGRGNIQQNYTVRFRNNDLIKKIYLPIENELNKEAKIMNKLFSNDIIDDNY